MKNSINQLLYFQHLGQVNIKNDYQNQNGVNQRFVQKHDIQNIKHD